jgi:hypothetical protein
LCLLLALKIPPIFASVNRNFIFLFSNSQLKSFTGTYRKSIPLHVLFYVSKINPKNRNTISIRVYMSSALHRAFLGLTTKEKSMFFDFEAMEMKEAAVCQIIIWHFPASFISILIRKNIDF